MVKTHENLCEPCGSRAINQRSEQSIFQRQQLFRRGELSHRPVVHHQNVVGVHDGVEAVRDGDDSAVLKLRTDHFLDGKRGRGRERKDCVRGYHGRMCEWRTDIRALGGRIQL